MSVRDLECHGGGALWATPVQVEDDSYGIYALCNNSALSAFRMGDLVEAVPKWRAPTSGLLGWPASRRNDHGGPPPGGHATDSVQAVIEAWYQDGAVFTAKMPGLLLTAWPDDMGRDEVVEVLERTTPPEWKLGEIPTTLMRALQLINDVDFCVDLDFPASAP